MRVLDTIGPILRPTHPGLPAETGAGSTTGSARRGLRSDAGATLVELLVALSILSIAAVAILAGIEGGIRTSDLHRKQSVGGANVRNYAEAVQDWVAEGNYGACLGGVDYRPAVDVNNPGGPGPVPYDVPVGYNADYDGVTALGGDGAGIACADDMGVQQVRFTMQSEDGRASEELVVVLRDPCGPGGTAGC